MKARIKIAALVVLALGLAGVGWAQPQQQAVTQPSRPGTPPSAGAPFQYTRQQTGTQPNGPGPGGFPPRWRGATANEDDPGPLVQIEGGRIIDENTVRTAREIDSHSTGTPMWENTKGFEKDTFVFARIIFKTGVGTGNGWGFGRRFGWWVDFPDADLNFSYRLQQMTSTKTDPECRTLRLTDPDLTDFPMIYMEHTGYMQLREEEVERLRSYLTNGGALFVNDFWSQHDWDGFEAQMKRVLPDRN